MLETWCGKRASICPLLSAAGKERLPRSAQAGWQAIFAAAFVNFTNCPSASRWRGAACFYQGKRQGTRQAAAKSKWNMLGRRSLEHFKPYGAAFLGKNAVFLFTFGPTALCCRLALCLFQRQNGLAREVICKICGKRALGRDCSSVHPDRVGGKKRLERCLHRPGYKKRGLLTKSPYFLVELGRIELPTS